MRVLLLEDDQQIAKFISKGLHELGYSVSHTANGDEGLELALNESFDVGIFDLMLPGADGLTVIRRMRDKRIKFPAIILSAKRSIDDRVRGLQLGGDDYMTKPFSFSELVARIQALMRRMNRVNEEHEGIIVVEDLHINILTRETFRSGKKIALQPKEFSLLEFLARHQGHVVTKTMIIERVWNYSFDPQTNIVQARISKIREKVDKGFEFPLIHTIRGLGYVMKRDYV
ncbi:MAG: response regulator transcription factor [Acidiferrobacterales bacterium]|nr:response regulator transcription factor [Acidiferrobacterales bacterium]